MKYISDKKGRTLFKMGNYILILKLFVNAVMSYFHILKIIENSN